MGKRIVAMILVLLGAIALIVGAFTFVNKGGTTYSIKVVAATLVIGLLFFVSGIGLIRATTDVMKIDEHLS